MTQQHVFYFQLTTDYSQSMNSREAIRNRLIKYLVPVILLSLTFNIPKFMEAKLVYRQAEPMVVFEPNLTTPDPSLNISLPTSAPSLESNSTPRWIPMVRYNPIYVFHHYLFKTSTQRSIL